MTSEATKYEIRDTSSERSEPASRISYLIFSVLLLAFALRVWNLTGVPPGLTHDEANHGREAIGILNGVYRYFFPLNYGSEPIYSYTVAGSMALLGRGLFALRLVNAIFGVGAVALTYAWAAPRLGRATALLGATLMAVSFWPIASSREALRAGMLPFFMLLAVWAFWRIRNYELGIRNEAEGAYAKDAQGAKNAKEEALRPLPPWRSSGELRRSSLAVVLFGFSLAATLHIYLAARVSWLLFPLFLGYLALFHRATFRQTWRRALAGLLLGALLSAPLFLYLRAHPEMQTRLDMLDGPLQAIAAGQWGSVLANARDALLAFVWPGYGDQFLAYNIPGRPVFDAVSAVFFIVGLAVCLARWRRPVNAFLLLWFLVGIAPSLITGPTANTTRNLAALPVVFLISAVGFVALAGRVTNDERRTTSEEGEGEAHAKDAKGAKSAKDDKSLRPSPPWRSWREVSSVVARRSTLVVAGLWIAFAGYVSARDYFWRWAESADVRGAYQHTLTAALAYVQANYPDANPVAFSSVYPGAAHDPSIALVLAAGNPALSETARWADGGSALVVPPGRSLAVVPASTPPHPVFIPWLEALETIDLRPDDLDPRFTLYNLDGDRITAELGATGAASRANFNGAVELVNARWLNESVRPGETAELLTVWRVLDPTRAGPANPPTFASDAVLFTHVLDGAGGLLAQSDRLDAPSWGWRTGDLFIQVHALTVPPAAAPGDYAAVVGFYDRATGVRLPVAGGGDTAAAPALRVSE